MRVHDTEISFRTPAGSVEITEYHDEGPGFRYPSRWNARVVALGDNGIGVVNLNRATQIELHQELERLKDLFESAVTAVLEPSPS